MNNLPKFISIRTSDAVHYINVNQVQLVRVTDYSIEFIFEDGSQCFKGNDYPTAKAAWIEVWKVTP